MESLAWLESGSRMVLVLVPKGLKVTVYHSQDEIHILTTNAGDAIGAGVVPGWRLPVAEPFS